MQELRTHTVTKNPLKGWQVNREEIKFIGKDLQRPECILAEPDGTIWTADARGGMMKINPDGMQQLITPQINGNSNGSTDFNNRYVQSNGSLPNGLCFDQQGNFIIANWGTDSIEVMTRKGDKTVLISEIDGIPLGKTNFPLRDSKGRIWFTITTRTVPWTEQLNTKAADGYIALMDEHGVRIVADGLCGTNEIRFDDNEEFLYVVESTGWRVSRYRVWPNGNLTQREIYGPDKLRGFPDGFAFDEYGNLWITIIFTDELIAITPDGEELLLLDDSQTDTKKRLFEHFNNSTITGEILGSVKGTVCPWMSSLTFGGADRKTVYLASLRGTTIPYFQSPVAGQKMIHWK